MIDILIGILLFVIGFAVMATLLISGAFCGLMATRKVFDFMEEMEDENADND